MRTLALALALLPAPALLAQPTEQTVLKLAGMESVDVRKDIRYDGERTFDLYRPPNAKEALPLVVFVNGVGRPDLKEWGQYISWPRLAAVRGMAAITYQTAGDGSATQTAALLKHVREHAGDLKIDASRIALWACSANVRLATNMIAEQDFRAAALYYGIMSTPPKANGIPVFVTRAGLDVASINDSIDRWVTQAVSLELPVTFIAYPQGRHGFDLIDDTHESRAIIGQTLDFLHYHLTHPRAAHTEPVTPAALQRLGVDAAIARLNELRKTHPKALVLQEQSLNTFGYVLLGENKAADAVKVFELMASLYPESANAHDSLGDAYEAAGRAAEAIRESERALALSETLSEPQRTAIRESAEGKIKRLRK